MEITVINDIKKRRSKNKTEEDVPMVDSSKFKIGEVDINKTVKEFKELIYEKLNLSSQLSRGRLGIMLSIKKDGKEIRTFLSDDYKQLLFYDRVSDPNALFYVKDIGPQINYRLVYILEYLGPLLFTLLFFIRYTFIFKKNNPDKNFQTHVILYFFMAFFHYTKRIAESLFVHIFSRSTMPLTNLFKNCVYYWGIFGILCGYTLFNPYGKDITFLKFPRYLMIAFFFSAEMYNLKTHIILRDIKIKGKGKKYMPPRTDGFELVTCANYMYEFFAWVCFSAFSLNIFVIFLLFVDFYK